MNRFARIMQALGWIGVALLTVVWSQGFLVRDDTPQLARHSTLALGAALLCVLPRFWTVTYLLLAARGRGALRQGAPATGERSARSRRIALVASGVALVGLSGSFALAGAILLRRTSPVVHAIAGFVAVALQVAALILERRALLADAAEMRALPGSAGVPSDLSGEPIRSAS